MGHYASEMSCSTCGGIGAGSYQCICPPPVDRTANWFVIDSDFTVQTCDEFLKKNEHQSGARMRLAFMTKFEHRDQAELYARDDCERAVQTARERLTALKKICKVIRPWEKK